MDRLYNVTDPEGFREEVNGSKSSSETSPGHPYGSFMYDGMEAVGHASDVFERMTGEPENPLEPKVMTDGGEDQDAQTMKDVSHTREGYDGVQESMERGVAEGEEEYEKIADGGVSSMPIGGMPGNPPAGKTTETGYNMGDIT